MTSHDEALRALADWCNDRQVHWAAQDGDYAQGRVNAFCEVEYEIRQRLAALLTTRQEVVPVAWISERELLSLHAVPQMNLASHEVLLSASKAANRNIPLYTSTGQTGCKDATVNRNRPAQEPGGVECMKCGRIFIGAECHSVCGVCVADTSTGQTSDARDAFIRDVAAQKPEKPDYWSPCGQCERNAERAQELIDDAAMRQGAE